MKYFPYGTNASRERSQETLLSKLGTWATFAVASWCGAILLWKVFEFFLNGGR